MSVVVVDTTVFAAPFSPRSDELVARYDPHLKGQRVLISFQTATEIRYGALVARWGLAKMSKLEEVLARSTVVPAHERLVREAARLRYECRQTGHPLHQSVHAGDLWVATTALLIGATLVTADRVFDGAPGLTVVREPE